MPRSAIADLALATLALIASVAALKFAQNLIAPIVLGIVFAVVLAPAVRILTRIGVPASVCAFGALVLTGLGLATALAAISPVISQFLEEIPRLQFQVFQWINSITDAVGASGSLGQNITDLDGDEAMAAAIPSLLSALWYAPNFMAQLLIFSGTLFFFLLTRDDLYGVIPSKADDLRRADRAVSHYFTTIALINAGLGLAVFAATSLYNLPNPILWGFAAFVLNFILYLGPISLIAALFVSGGIEFQGVMILAPALTFLAFNLIEAQFVTPALVGQRMHLNPLGVFLAILFGLWLWGPIGGIVALPVLVWVSAFAIPSEGTDRTLSAPKNQPQQS
ncbi:AI-2E family transporter [Primorskyibacter sp. S187A]|uniref:AI-2E family transporter n=1 Tax=Primorskyibacter sp. S187A TaxID=3415130 RepID=UPI003C7BE581